MTQNRLFHAWMRGAILIAMLGLYVETASAQVVSTWTGNPTADAFVRASNTGGNYGGAGALMVAGSSSGSGIYQTLMRFNLAGAKSQFDTQYGSGNWTITGVTLRLAGNVSTQGGVSPNFPAINSGDFGIRWLSNDGWTEGTGTPGVPTANGVTYGDLAALTGLSDLTLGSFTFTPPGNNVAVTWTLPASASGFVSDIAAGSDVSLLFTPGDATVSYLFNARSFGTSANWPLLTVTAIPEPSAFALAVVGAVWIGLIRWRRNAA